MSEKKFIYGILYDYYGDLLKDNQASIIDMYYNLDYSLSEIAEEMNISRQGVYDALKRAEKSLAGYEEKIKDRENIYFVISASLSVIGQLPSTNLNP